MLAIALSVSTVRLQIDTNSRVRKDLSRHVELNLGKHLDKMIDDAATALASF